MMKWSMHACMKDRFDTHSIVLTQGEFLQEQGSAGKDLVDYLPKNWYIVSHVQDVCK